MKEALFAYESVIEVAELVRGQEITLPVLFATRAGEVSGIRRTEDRRLGETHFVQEFRVEALGDEAVSTFNHHTSVPLIGKH